MHVLPSRLASLSALPLLLISSLCLCSNLHTHLEERYMAVVHVSRAVTLHPAGPLGLEIGVLVGRSRPRVEVLDRGKQEVHGVAQKSLEWRNNCILKAFEFCEKKLA